MVDKERLAALRAKHRPESVVDPRVYVDPHEGHHTHVQGNMTRCSCGGSGGIFSIALPDWDDSDPRWLDLMRNGPCSICGLDGWDSYDDFFA